MGNLSTRNASVYEFENSYYEKMVAKNETSNLLFDVRNEEKEQYIAHIAGNSSDEDVRKYIENRSYHVFEQISKSRNGIIDLCSKKS